MIVENDPVVQHVLEATLDYGGFTHESATTAHAAADMFHQKTYDAIVLELSLPDMPGTELIKSLRKESDLPILVVSALIGEEHRIEALDTGADDFIPKPFLPGELLARIRAALRRHGSPARGATTIRIGDIEFNPEQPFIRSGRKAMSLTKTEHALLVALARKPSKAISNKELAEAIWGTYDENKDRNLRVIINHLRRKIEPIPKYPAYIISHHGVGYRLQT